MGKFVPSPHKLILGGPNQERSGGHHERRLRSYTKRLQILSQGQYGRRPPKVNREERKY